jgi:serine/threonine-protein kinase
LDPTTSHPTRFGRYELLRLLARGGMGEVFLARMQGTAGWEKQLVIKRILPHLAEDPEFCRRFIDEARISVGLSHGNLVPVFELGEVEGSLFLAMEYVDGWDLRSLHRAALAGHTRMPDELVAFVGAELCKGLAYVHHKRDDEGRPLGLVHRDVSPSNVLISRDGEVKLVDFGIATAHGRATLTATGELRGKLAYMSPEQARGERVDSRTDIFSLGVVMFELLTGQRPFDGANDMELLRRIQEGDRRPIRSLRPDLAPRLADIVERALAPRREDRFGEVEEMLMALMQLLFAETGPVTGSRLARFIEREMRMPRTRPGRPGLDELLNAELDRAAAERSDRSATPSRPREPGTGPSMGTGSSTGSAGRRGVPSREATMTRAAAPERPGAGRRGLWATLAAVVALLAVTAAGAAWWRRSFEVQVQTQPDGAAVWVDGRPSGRSGTPLRLRRGEHQVRLELDGYEPVDRSVSVPAQTRIEAVLEARLRQVLFQSSPPGASVRIDGGAAFPAGVTQAVVPGREYEIVLELPGHRAVRERHTFAPDESVFARVLSPLADEGSGGVAEPAAGTPPGAAMADGDAPGGPGGGGTGPGSDDGGTAAGTAPRPTPRPGLREGSGAAGAGTLVVRFAAAPMVGRVLVDGVAIGEVRSLRGTFALPPGRHRIEVVNEAQGVRDGETIEVTAGGEHVLSVDWQDAAR